MRTLLSVCILSLFFISANAQQQLTKKSGAISIKEATTISEEKTKQTVQDGIFNYIILTKGPDQLEAILMAAKHLRATNENQFGEFHVVIYGSGVKKLAEIEKIGEELKSGIELGVTTLVCSISVKKSGIEPDKIYELVKPVENAIAYNLELQQKGWISLEL